MSKPEAATFFDAIAGRYERAYALSGEVSRLRMRRVVAELPPRGRVLVLGVGTGRELSALMDAGHAPTGVDISSEMLARCARRTRPVPLALADFWKPLPFDGAAFDATIALHGTLAHPPDEASMARLGREVARVVRPGGALVVEVPSPAWLERVSRDGEPRVRRTGTRTCVYEDPTVGAAIETRVLDEPEWLAALSSCWETRVERLGEVEWLIVARRI